MEGIQLGERGHLWSLSAGQTTSSLECVCVCPFALLQDQSGSTGAGREGDGVGGGEGAFLDCSERLVQNCTKTCRRRLALKKQLKSY